MLEAVRSVSNPVLFVPSSPAQHPRAAAASSEMPGGLLRHRVFVFLVFDDRFCSQTKAFREWSQVRWEGVRISAPAINQSVVVAVVVVLASEKTVALGTSILVDSL